MKWKHFSKVRFVQKCTVVEEVHRCFTQVHLTIPQCRNTLLQAKLLHSTFYLDLSNSIKVFQLKYSYSTKWPISE